MASTNSMFKVDRMLEPNEQGWLIASTGVSLEKDGYDTEHYSSSNEFRLRTQFNTRQLISFSSDVEEIEEYDIENKVSLGGKEHWFSGDVYTYAFNSPQDKIDYDVRNASWDNTRKAPNRIHVTHAVKSVAENYFERAKRKL